MYWLGVWFIHMFGISKYAERASHPIDADCSCQRIFQIFGLWNLFSSFDAKDHLVVLHKGSRINSNLNAFKPHVCQCFMNHNSPFKIIISHGTNEAYKIAVSPLPKDKRSARVSLVEIVPKCFKHANPKASIAKMSHQKKKFGPSSSANYEIWCSFTMAKGSRLLPIILPQQQCWLVSVAWKCTIWSVNISLKSKTWCGTYDKRKRENIRRLVHEFIGVGFRAPPHPVLCLFADHMWSRRDMHGIFEIPKLDSLKLDFTVVIFLVDEDIICLNIYPE